LYIYSQIKSFSLHYKRIILVLFITTILSLYLNKAIAQNIFEIKQTSNIYLEIEKKAIESHNNSEYSEALKYYLLLSKISKQNNKEEYYVRSLIGLSKVFHNVDKIEYSCFYSKESIKESKKISNK